MMRSLKGAHREIVRAHRANLCLRPKELLKFDRRIIFDVLFAVRALVGYFTGGEIHFIAHHSRVPASRKELWKCAFTSLIDSESSNQGFPIKGRYVHGARYERNALHHDRSLRGQEQALARGERPNVASDPGSSKTLGEVRKSAHLWPNGCCSLHSGVQIIDCGAHESSPFVMG